MSDMRIFLAIAALSLAGLIIFWQPSAEILFWQENVASSSILEKRTNNDAIVLHNQTRQTSSELDSGNKKHALSDDNVDVFIPDPDAIASMQKARLEGDSRAPNLVEHHARETPTAEELEDHEQYLEYERRQQKRVYRAYVEASKIKTTQLRNMIEQGKAEGVSAEDIAFAEKKIRGIEEMAATLQQEHPDIMEESYQPPSDWLIETLGKDDDSIKTDDFATNID